MSEKSKAKLLSDEFSDIVRDLRTDALEPDKVDRKNKAPDWYLPDDQIAIELKSTSVNLSAVKKNGD